MRKDKIIRLLTISMLLVNVMYSQTTGKIAGRVVDAKTGEPIPGANIWLEGTSLGSASDNNGSYFIINVPPGDYTIIAQVIGYKIEKIKGV
ncbi:MAG: TonB-dependent receptor, partial [Candidatus Neomarinimicrobiota bacterium]